MFWDQPYRGKLVRWGTALHDRFMLPHFLWADFADVIGDLKERRPAGGARLVPARTSSSASRCIGEIEAVGRQLELRQALEPWHVLGEESAAGGTARYVDTSLDRVRCRSSTAPDGAAMP